MHACQVAYIELIHLFSSTLSQLTVPTAVGAKTAGSAGAKAKAKEDVKGSVGRKQEGGRRQEGAAAAGGGSPKPVHAELGGLRMGGAGSTTGEPLHA
jgi:hypothetical protein